MDLLRFPNRIYLTKATGKMDLCMEKENFQQTLFLMKANFGTDLLRALEVIKPVFYSTTVNSKITR
jgi:hypothetical protein